jgi:hypothetical protein
MALDLANLDPERIPDMAATAFDDAEQDYLIPEFNAPDMKTSFKDLGMLALPISARLPKPMGSKVVAGLNAMTMAMRAIKKGKVREALARSREADRALADVERSLKATVGRYGNIMRTQTNPEIANLDLRSEAAQGLDSQLLDLLKSSGMQGGGRAVTDRMNEFDKFAQQMQFKREQHKLNVIKTMLDAHRLLKPVQTDDLINLDQINRERSLSGLAPMRLEEYMQMKATLRPETTPNSVKEFERSKEDPEYAEFLEGRKPKGSQGASSIQEYEYAKQQGYTGSFVDFKKEISGRRNRRDRFDKEPGAGGTAERFDQFANPGAKAMPPAASTTQAPPTAITPDRVEALIRSQLFEAKADPRKVYGDLQQKYEQTGDEMFNPSKYLNLFPGETFISQ